MQRKHWHHSLLLLGIIAVILSLGLTSFAAPATSGLWMESPAATPTFTPEPTATTPPTPTLEPTATSEPTPTALPEATPTEPPAPTATPEQPTPEPELSPTLPPEQPPTATVTPWPTATPQAPLAPAQLTPPAILPPTPEAQAASSPITATVGMSTTNTSKNLVSLINTFVRYSLYFLLGLGIIFFLILIFFLYALYRRSQAFHQEE